MADSSKPLYEEIARKVRSIPLDESTPSYEWEELVQKMCASNDSILHGIGLRELHELNLRRAKK